MNGSYLLSPLALAAKVQSISHGYRKYLIGSHVIFFRCQPFDRVEVVRILNQRMDVPAHL
ncbi:type II toxin-antitoxin system RelE/ParE family toxin [Candidatus Aalborgicola defluviihabitans]|uniref:type II toxin-antitoxin system RelE/ParE family toxin n=1 Tax=Candidatus Aalborgicola defluviihabitans TaxID=3386187 RepID=UPI001D37506B|nr:type II toxin-antitoxin system RelE/ParE family toxin [Burkholderiales bacterium]